MVFCLILVLVLRHWKGFWTALRRPRLFWTLALAAVLVAGNWTLYVIAVHSGNTLDAALGYFINPLLSAALGVVVLRERLSVAQWIAFGFGGAAVVVLSIGYGAVPYFALLLASLFALYSLVKKRISGQVGPLEGLSIETTALFPVAVGYIVYLTVIGQSTVPVDSGYFWVMVASGPLTAIPLILFAFAASKVSLATIGMMQYITPTMQFLLGWLVFQEPLPPERLAGFALIWVAVTIFAVDAVAKSRRAQRLLRAEEDDDERE